MEVKINKEIMDYSETMFFGLSLRQFFFSAFACGIAVLIYFRLEPLLGLETTSWICIVQVCVPDTQGTDDRQLQLLLCHSIGGC